MNYKISRALTEKLSQAEFLVLEEMRELPTCESKVNNLARLLVAIQEMRGAYKEQ
jgi:hypothetical protein